MYVFICTSWPCSSGWLTSPELGFPQGPPRGVRVGPPSRRPEALFQASTVFSGRWCTWSPCLGTCRLSLAPEAWGTLVLAWHCWGRLQPPGRQGSKAQASKFWTRVTSLGKVLCAWGTPSQQASVWESAFGGQGCTVSGSWWEAVCGSFISRVTWCVYVCVVIVMCRRKFLEAGTLYTYSSLCLWDIAGFHSLLIEEIPSIPSLLSVFNHE